MSGGSYNYAYKQAENFAEFLTTQSSADGAAEARMSFRDHLKLVAEAMRMIEWVDSYDNSPGDEIEAIAKCLGGSVKGLADHEPVDMITKQQRVEVLKEACELTCIYCKKGIPARIDAPFSLNWLHSNGSFCKVPSIRNRIADLEKK